VRRKYITFLSVIGSSAAIWFNVALEESVDVHDSRGGVIVICLASWSMSVIAPLLYLRSRR